MLAVSILSGPATAQAGLDARLAEAEQKLDSDVQSCRPVNPAEFADLLNEAMANKQRAAKAAKKGVPINQAQVDADLGKAAMLFARALTAQALQCIQAAAQQHAQVTREQLEQLPVGHRPADLVASCPTDTVPTITSRAAAGAGAMALSLTCAAPADKGMVEIYRTHNAVRAEYGAPPLVRDPALELGAGQYVGELLRVGRPVHASRTGRGNIRENISQGLPGWSPGQLLQAWVRERANFVPGTFPNVSRTHNWYDVGHWAQMIWVRTVLIGCARAAGISASFLVCRYGPGGNRDGEQVGIPPREYTVAAPTLPTTEVFTPRPQPQPRTVQTTTPATDTMTVRTAPAFDLGIYAGGAWTTDWFRIGEQPEDLFIDFDNSLIGLPPNMFGYDGTILLPPMVTAPPVCTAAPDAGSVPLTDRLDGSEAKLYFDISVGQNINLDDYLKLLREAQANWKAANEAGANGASANVERAAADLKTAQKLYQRAYKAAANNTVDTEVLPPDLPTKEVYNPADLPKCPLEIM